VFNNSTKIISGEHITYIALLLKSEILHSKKRNKMLVKTIEHASKEYEEMIRLRITVLLEPIGVSPSFIDQEKEKEDVLIGAFERNELIGCCVLTKKSGSTIQLRQMAVALHLQGKGVGKKIVQFAERWSAEAGFKTLILHARDVVIPFYERCGYTILGNGFEEVNIPHHVMQKQL